LPSWIRPRGLLLNFITFRFHPQGLLFFYHRDFTLMAYLFFRSSLVALMLVGFLPSSFSCSVPSAVSFGLLALGSITYRLCLLRRKLDFADRREFICTLLHFRIT